MKYTEKVERELLDKCEDIPFGNSLYQDECFIVNMAHTPSRALRTVGLSLSDRLRAVQELEFSMERLQVDLDEIQHRLDAGVDEFESRRLDISRREKLSKIAQTAKLTKDALFEIEYFRALLARLPKMTRVEFEEQEKAYFTETLVRQAVGLPEATASLHAMGIHGETTLNLRAPRLSEQLSLTAVEFATNHILPIDPVKTLKGG